MESPNAMPSMQKMAKHRWGFPVGCILAFCLLLSAYSNHFHNSFHFDDSHVIQNNLYLRTLWNIPTFFVDATTFSTLPTNSTYRPLLSATLALDYWIGGEIDPWQFHVTQFVLLMLLGVGLVFLFLRIMDLTALHWWNRYAALFAAVFFCVHTANTETVNYISSRSDLLSTLGIVGAFLMYLFLPRWRRFHLYLVPMVLGALAKPPAVIFAPLLLVLVLLFEQDVSCAEIFSSKCWPKVKTALGRVLPACVVGVLVFGFIEAMNSSGLAYGGGSRLGYLLTQPFVWLHYFRLFFLPIGLTADTDWKLLSDWYDTRFFAGVLFISFLLVIVWMSSNRKEWRPVAFGVVWFIFGLLPASSIFPLAEVANEHRIFLPYIGLSLAMVWWLALQVHKWGMARPGGSPVVISASCVVALLTLGGHAVGSYERNKVWRSEETLWADVVQKSPANGRGWMNYGLTQMAQGKYVEAKRLFDQAKIHTPNYAILEINLGIVNDQLGEPVLAEQYFERALQLQPDYVGGHYYYGRWLVPQGRSGEAIAHLQRAVELSPGLAESRTLLLNLYFAKGDEESLRMLMQNTLAVSPDDPVALAYANETIPITVNPPNAPAYYRRGLALTSQESHLDAALTYRQSLRTDPASADAHNNLGWSLAQLGFFEEALPVFEEALRLGPESTLVRSNLAWVRTQLPSP